MIATIMLAILASASASTLNIVNNCDRDVEISLIYFPSGSGIECHPMLLLASEEQATIDNFYPEEDVILIKSSKKSDSTSFTFIDSLQNVMGTTEDIDGKCGLLADSGDINVYSVTPDVPYLTICSNEPAEDPEIAPEDAPAPAPAPATETDQIAITNKCSNDFEFAQLRINPRINVVCFGATSVPAGNELSYEPIGYMEYVAIKTDSIKNTPNFEYLGTLQGLVDLEGDADGACKDLIDAGYNGVFASLAPQMILCA